MTQPRKGVAPHPFTLSPSATPLHAEWSPHPKLPSQITSSSSSIPTQSDKGVAISPHRKGVAPHPSPHPCLADSLAYRRGVRRALDALATRPAEGPKPDPVCRFGAGLACLAGETCPNPNHRGERHS